MPHSTSVQMLGSVGRANNRSSALNRATALYAHARNQGQHNELRFLLNKRSSSLLTLDELDAGSDTGARLIDGIQLVPICQIRGSEGRSGDFDRDFHPLQDRTRQRWLSVAMAREQGRYLPPVDLIQIGEIYFVRDGHHRISVAGALGQPDIEARVVVWQVSGPLPWEAPATGEERGLRERLNRGRGSAAGLWENALPSLRHLADAVEAGLKAAMTQLTAAVSGQ